jgi:hypothetical protein
MVLQTGLADEQDAIQAAFIENIQPAVFDWDKDEVLSDTYELKLKLKAEQCVQNK